MTIQQTQKRIVGFGCKNIKETLKSVTDLFGQLQGSGDPTNTKSWDIDLLVIFPFGNDYENNYFLDDFFACIQREREIWKDGNFYELHVMECNVTTVSVVFPLAVRF